jgi:nucleoside-diphosphate-sugar epimerase
MRSALVFGGSGQLGVAAAERLLAAGWRVSIVTRDRRLPPEPALARRATLLDGTGKSRADVILGLGGTVDAVFDPTAYDEADAQDLLRAQGRFGGLVAVSSASVYAAPDGRSLVESSQSGLAAFDCPLAETAPTVTPGPKGYSSRKVAMERALLASDAPVTILRPCAIYGTHTRHPREWWFIKRALDGRKSVPVAYGARSVFHTSSARGLADLAVLCMERPEKRLLNTADRTALSVAEIAAAIARATDLPLALSPFDGPPVGPAHVGSTPWSSEHPIVLDTAQAQRLGWEAGDYGQQVVEACRWALEAARRGDWRATFTRFADYGYDPFDYAAEDAFLAFA